MLSVIFMLIALGFLVLDAVGYKLPSIENLQSLGIACIVISIVVRGFT